MDSTTEPLTLDSAVDSIMANDAEAPETTEGEELEVSETEEVEVEASDDEDTTEADTDEEAETDEAEADEADEEESDEDEAEEDEEDDEPDLITVTVDGTEQAVTLDELKRGYSGQAKIQKDLAQNAQTRKQLEQAAQALLKQQDEILQLHQQAQQGGFKAPPQAPDQTLLDNDPAEYMRQRVRYENEVAEFQNEQQRIAQLQQQKQAYEQSQRSKHIAAQFETLKQRIPELADEKTAPEYAKKLLETGTAYQFTTEELSNIDDPRALELLNDAMKYRELKAKQAASKKPPKPTRNIKAKAARKAAPDAKAKVAKSRFQKTASISDAVDAFLSSQNP